MHRPSTHRKKKSRKFEAGQTQSPPAIQSDLWWPSEGVIFGENDGVCAPEVESTERLHIEVSASLVPPVLGGGFRSLEVMLAAGTTEFFIPAFLNCEL